MDINQIGMFHIRVEFDVLLNVYLSIILATDQLNTQILVL